MESEFDYGLKTPFEYAKGGENIPASFITLNEPGAPHIAEVGMIRQWIQQAMQHAEDAVSEEAKEQIRDDQKAADEEAKKTGLPPKTEPIDGPTILALFAASDVPLHRVYQTATELLKGKGIALLDGEQAMVPSLWKKLTAQDLEAMIGDYIATFLLR